MAYLVQEGQLARGLIKQSWVVVNDILACIIGKIACWQEPLLRISSDNLHSPSFLLVSTIGPELLTVNNYLHSKHFGV